MILKQGFVVWGFFNLFWTTDFFKNLNIAVGILPQNARTHPFAHHSRFLNALQISELQIKNSCPAAFGTVNK